LFHFIESTFHHPQKEFAMKASIVKIGSLALSLACLSMPLRASAGEITGAGATFPYPVYSKWAEAYKAQRDLSLNYQSIGSGGGIKQIEAKTVDFGASDMPLKPEKLKEDGLVQWPMIMGGVVPVVNVTGIAAGQLKLSGAVLANIFLGTIKKWNDKEIVSLNKGLKLPAQDIAVVHRSDGSGTTFLFTNYLMKVSKDWADKVGNNTAVEWPVGIGGKGNEGVANFTAQTPGSIGYVEYAYALQNKLAYTMLASHDGAYINPSSATFQSAASHADWKNAPGFYLVLTEQPGKESWPITGASFILMHTVQEKPDRASEALNFFSWCYANGTKMAEELNYVPMPKPVVDIVEKTWADQIKAADGKVVYTK
jgi:phosphate transport system substrate-binding protein